MPSPDTFSIKPIGQFVKKYLAHSKVSVDPFARNCPWATHTNDLAPDTGAAHHMKALDFLRTLEREGVRADVVIFDPPYSLRQAKECYEECGYNFSPADSREAGRWRAEKDVADRLLLEGGLFLSFGWSTVGIGKGVEAYGIEEILLVCHGGAHNDTLCMAQRKACLRPRGGLYSMEG
jgi:hypothetical protein